MHDAFGGILKEWRQLRRMSQLDLALSAGVSARHVSFLETGRSQPSRGMILRLSDELGLPRSARNQLLAAAGMAAVYESRPLSDQDMQPFQQALDWTLARHAPYPAIALDRHWRVVSMNAPAKAIYANVGVQIGDSLLEHILHSDALRGAITNLDEVERLLLARLRTELAHFGKDPVLEAAITELQARVSDDESPTRSLPAIIPTHYRAGGMILSFFSTVAQFGGTEDIAMSELRIELYFPADEGTRHILIAMGAEN